MKEVDIRPWIYQMEVQGGGIFLQLSSGSVRNLKPEMVMGAFASFMDTVLEEFALMIHRLEIYALLENNRIVDLYVQRQGEISLLGNIYVGKVEKAARDLKAVFVRISNDQICFLPLKDCLDPIYKMPGRQGEPKPGDELLVQVRFDHC